MPDPIEIYWCLQHEDRAEGPISRCYFALFADSLDKCELTLAEVTPKMPAAWEGPGLW